MKIPAGLAKGDHRILLSDADTVNRMQNMAGMMNRFIDLPEAVSLLNQERTQQQAVRLAGGGEPDRLLRRQDAAEPALVGAERDAGGPRAEPVDVHVAGDGRGADGAAVRLRGDRQLLAAHSREIGKMKNIIGSDGALPVTVACCLLAALRYSPGQTQTWTQGEFADFEKGIIKNLSVRSDGLLTLAPRSHEMFDPSTAYLWALAQDSKGNLYAGGGTDARSCTASRPTARARCWRTSTRLEIHAIVVDSKDRVYVSHLAGRQGLPHRRRTASRKSSTIPRRSTSGRWRSTARAICIVATGDQGEIHRVTPDGKGRVFFKSEETHVRSMAIDPNDNLIVGTEPGGLVLRVSPAGEGFVLYQMAKREVTAVAVARDGSIYAAAVGAKQAAARLQRRAAAASAGVRRRSP